ncbi:hypothetical protein [Vibrio sp. J502]
MASVNLQDCLAFTISDLPSQYPLVRRS